MPLGGRRQPLYSGGADAARADFIRFLAACYYEPDRQFAEERLFDSMLEAAACIHPELAALAQRLRQAYLEAPLEELLVDYTRLFLGPAPVLAQPYESVWLRGTHELMQESTLDVLRCYAEGGFEIDGGFRDMPDHIAVELEFLYLLVHREVQEPVNGEALAPVRALRSRFLREHLARWSTPFAAALMAHAQCAFYRRLGEITERLVVMEAERENRHPPLRT